MSTESGVTKVGLTGFLTPEGTFYACKYGHHCDFAQTVYALAVKQNPKLRMLRDIGEGYELFLNRAGFVAMGSKGPPFRGHAHVRFPMGSNASKVTLAQKAWFHEHMDELDEEQQCRVKRDLYLYAEDADEPVRDP